VAREGGDLALQRVHWPEPFLAGRTVRLAAEALWESPVSSWEGESPTRSRCSSTRCLLQLHHIGRVGESGISRPRPALVHLCAASLLQTRASRAMSPSVNSISHTPGAGPIGPWALTTGRATKRSPSQQPPRTEITHIRFYFLPVRLNAALPWSGASPWGMPTFISFAVQTLQPPPASHAGRNVGQQGASRALTPGKILPSSCLRPASRRIS
jgi:hypothetical protein